MTVVAWTFSQSLFWRWFPFPSPWIMRCRRWSTRPGLFYVLQIFPWTASFRVNSKIVAWSTVRRILWRFLTCVRHAFFSMWRSCPGYVLKVYYWWRTCLWLAFRKQFAGKAYLKINLLVKTLLHRHSMEVRRSGLWAPVHASSTSSDERASGLTCVASLNLLFTSREQKISIDLKIVVPSS